MAGTPMQVILTRAGHSSLDTTLNYVRLGEVLNSQSAQIGKPFPPLPADLIAGGSGQPKGHADPGPGQNAAELIENLSGNVFSLVEAPGIEPGSARLPINLHSRT